jgi:hypothetical protein
MQRHVALPEIVEGDPIPLWLLTLLSTIKEDVELLIGSRGEEDLVSRAIFRGDIDVVSVEAPALTQITAKGEGFDISGSDVAGLDDHVKLINNVIALANDVASLRATVDSLITNLNSGSTTTVTRIA